MKLHLSSSITNAELAQVFSFVAQVLKLQPQDRYRARAYEEAGVVISQLNNELADTFARLKTTHPETVAEEFAEQMDNLPGIGEHIAQKLTNLFVTGDIPAFQKYVQDIPEGVYPLVQLYGIGAKKALLLAQHFHLTDPDIAIEKLLIAAQAGQVRKLEGFGEKSEQDLITTLKQKYNTNRIPLKEALVVANTIKTALEQSPYVSDVTFLGSLRRGAQTVGDIDLGAITTNIAEMKAYIKKLPNVKTVLAAGDNVIRIILKNNWQVDIKLSNSEEWGSFLQHFTGSKEHNIRLREYALKKGFSLSEHGIKIKATGQMKTFKDEKTFYHFLGLSFIPPAERISGSEIEAHQL